MDERESKIEVERNKTTDRGGVGKAVVMAICGTLVYYHCAFGNSSLLSLIADVLIVLLCSLAILGLLFRQLNISVPVDPLEWQISQDAASTMVACLANTVGAAESVLRVAATGHDKRLFVKILALMSDTIRPSGTKVTNTLQSKGKGKGITISGVITSCRSDYWLSSVCTYYQLWGVSYLALQLLMLDYAYYVFTCLLRAPNGLARVYLVLRLSNVASAEYADNM